MNKHDIVYLTKKDFIRVLEIVTMMDMYNDVAGVDEAKQILVNALKEQQPNAPIPT